MRSVRSKKENRDGDEARNLYSILPSSCTSRDASPSAECSVNMGCDGKLFALICDSLLFIKITDAGPKLCPELRETAPYEGAENYFLRDTLVSLVTVTCTALPESKPKKRRGLM